MGSFSIMHWLIVLAVVVLIFGTKKLGHVGSDLGKAVKGFKDGMNGKTEDGMKRLPSSNIETTETAEETDVKMKQ